MRSNRSRREVELLADFAVRHSRRRQLGYLKLLSRQLITRRPNSPSALLARRAQLLARAFRPGNASQCVEYLSRSPQGRARLADAPVTAKPGPVGELQPCMVERLMPQMAPQRYVVQPLGLVVWGQDGTRVYQAAAQRRRGRALRE